jgi:hypothetical protein
MRLIDIVGLDILVGLTYFNAEGQVLRQEQFHGLIDECDENTTWVCPSDSGERRWIPSEPVAFRPAPGGAYRLTSTGQVVTDPFLLTSWMLTELQDERGRAYFDCKPNRAPLIQSRVPVEWKLAYRIDEDRIRRTIEAFGDEYIGRSVLLGITYFGPNNLLRRQEQFLGTIMVVDFDEGIVVSCDPDGHTFVLPGDPSWVEKAPSARYKLRSTGLVITNPDYLANLSIEQAD